MPKRKPDYKQMAFDTAVRNPERYLNILSSVKEFEGSMLDDDTLLRIVSKLYIIGEMTSPKIKIKEETTIDDIKDTVIQINASRNADGGFPKGYQSRFWTYMRTPSELGFVYARYKEVFKFSEIAKKLVEGEIDEQEAFSIQAMRYNRRSPYRNVLNDFNFFTFALNVLIEKRKRGSFLSYEQFIVLTYSKDGDIVKFFNIIDNNTFNDKEDVYNFVKHNYGETNKLTTVTADYPDVVRRVFLMAGFISIRFERIKKIQINENKMDYIHELLSVPFSLTEEEKEDAWKYFKKLDSDNQRLLSLVLKYRQEDQIDAKEYTSQLHEIINDYNIDERKILKCIKKVESDQFSVIPEFKEIPKPLRLEFFIAILLAIKYATEFIIHPNYKTDQLGKPYSHAPGGGGDLYLYTSDIFWLIEVTLIRNKNQQLNNETTSLIRHLGSDAQFENYKRRYLSLVAPVIHPDTKRFFDYSLVQTQFENMSIKIKPYNIEEFIEITKKKKNLSDMDKYSDKIFEDFKSNLPR